MGQRCTPLLSTLCSPCGKLRCIAGAEIKSNPKDWPDTTLRLPGLNGGFCSREGTNHSAGTMHHSPAGSHCTSIFFDVKIFTLPLFYSWTSTDVHAVLFHTVLRFSLPILLHNKTTFISQVRACASSQIS